MNLRRFIYAPLVLAIVAAAALQAVLIVRSGTVSADSIKFISIARRLADNPIDTIRAEDQHPGYSATVLATTRLVQGLGYRAEPQSWVVAGQIVTFVCGLLSIWVVWLLARELFGLQAANLAAWAFAVLPVPRWNAADAQSDTFHLLIYLLAVWLVCSGISEGRHWRLAAAGLVSGAAYWIRPEGVAVALVALACVAGVGLQARWGWRRVGLATGSLAAATLLVVAPYWMLAQKFTSKQLPGAKQLLASMITRPKADAVAPAPTATVPAPAAVAAPTQTSAAAPAPAPPPVSAPAPSAVDAASKSMPSRVARSIGAFLYSIGQGLKIVFVPFYFVGLFELFRRKTEWPGVIYLTILGVFQGCILVCLHLHAGYLALRHVLPLVALAMPFAALGIMRVAKWIERRGVQPSHALVGVAGISAVMVLPFTMRPFNREFIPVIEATHWVESRAEPGAGVVCNSPYVGFYGKLPIAEFSVHAPTLDAVLAQAGSSARYDYVILHVGAYQFRPEWIAQVEERYRQVQELPDPYCSPSRPRKVLVFEAKQLEARRTGASGPSL
jgi:hypothetical protein